MSDLDHIRKTLTILPTPKRGGWFVYACQRSGISLDSWKSIDTSVEAILSSITGAALSKGQLEQIIRALDDIQESVRQARWIRFLLARPSVAAHWREAFSEAISQPDILERATQKSALTEWLSISLNASSPPNCLDIIPLLDDKLLRQIRTSIDRTLKQYLRESRRLSRFEQTEVFEQLPAKQPEDTQDLLAAIDCLDAQSKAAIYLRFFEGLTLQSIAEKLDLVNPSKVHRILTNALAQLRKTLER